MVCDVSHTIGLCAGIYRTGGQNERFPGPISQHISPKNLYPREIQ